MNYLIFVAILMGLVLIHELGHYAVARWTGMRVERFSIFFGRPLVKFTRGETEWRIGWIPLGGYVKITGMTREELFPGPRKRRVELEDGSIHEYEEPAPPPPDPEIVKRAYFSQKPWKRIATIFAGPAVNIVLAYLIFVVAFGIGPRELQVVNPIRSIAASSPAADAGLLPGDRLLAVNGVATTESVETGLDAARQELVDNPGQRVVISIQRAGETFERSVTLRERSVDGRTIGQLGVNFSTVEGDRISSGLGGSFTDGADFTWTLVAENFKALGRVFTDSEARDQIGSVVGIGAVYDSVSEEGFLTVLRYIGYISLILGIFNLLPFLPLDGGHILFTVIEKLKGSAVPRAVYERASFVGLALLLFVFVFALQNDIGRLSGEGFDLNGR